MKEGVLIAPVEEKHYIEEKPKDGFAGAKPKGKYQGLTHTKNQ